MVQEAAAPDGSAGTQFGVRLQSLHSGKAGSSQRSAQGQGQQHDHQEVCCRARPCQCSILDALFLCHWLTPFDLSARLAGGPGQKIG